MPVIPAFAGMTISTIAPGVVIFSRFLYRTHVKVVLADYYKGESTLYTIRHIKGWLEPVLWWSLHPIGYAISGTYTMNIFWLSFMISWAIKWMILKQGGLRIYRRATPFFFGLILGEFIMGSLWSILAIVFQTPMYSFIN